MGGITEKTAALEAELRELSGILRKCDHGTNQGLPGVCPEDRPAARPSKLPRRGASDKPEADALSSAFAHIHQAAAKKASELLRFVKQIPAKIYTAAKQKVVAHYQKLAGRYGRKMALAVLAAGIMGTATPLPGGGLIAAAPLIGAAELYRRLAGQEKAFSPVVRAWVNVEGAAFFLPPVVKEGRWVTIGAHASDDDSGKHGGTHVYIDSDGTISRGPSGLVGKKPSELGRKVTAEHGANHPETGTPEGPESKLPPREKPEAAQPAEPQAVSAASLRDRAASEGRELPLADISRLNREIGELTQAAREVGERNPQAAHDLHDRIDALKNERDGLAGVQPGELVSEHDMQELTAPAKKPKRSKKPAAKPEKKPAETPAPSDPFTVGSTLHPKEALYRPVNVTRGGGNITEEFSNPGEPLEIVSVFANGAVEVRREDGETMVAPPGMFSEWKPKPKKAVRPVKRWLPWIRVKSSFFADCDRDDAGHCKPGTGGGGDGESAPEASGASKPDEAGDSSPRGQWQERQAARDKQRQAADSVSDHQGSTTAWSQISAVDDAVRAGNAEGVREKVNAAVASHQEQWGKAEQALTAAGATESDLAAFRKLRDKATEKIGQKAEKYGAQAEKVAAASAAVKELEAIEPPEPPEPDYPDEPTQEADEDESAFDKRHDAWEAENDKLVAAHEKATEKWESAHEKWEAKYERATGKAEAETEKLDDRLNDLSETLDEFNNDLTEETNGVQTSVLERLDAEDERDSEPEDVEKEEPEGEEDEKRAGAAVVKVVAPSGAHPCVPETLPAHLLPFPDIAQPDDYSCLACCAMGCGKVFGVGPDSLEEWKKILGTNVKESTRPERIIDYLSELGLAVEGRQDMTIDDLRDCWRRGLYVICMVQEYGVPSKQASYNYGHGVVSLGVSLGFVFVFDPSIDNVLRGEDADQASGLMPIAEEKFLQVWHDRDADDNHYRRYGIIVGPQTSTVKRYRPSHRKGRWVTIGAHASEGEEGKHGGTHVYIEDDGTISRGPAGMQGKKPSELGRKITAEHGEKHPETGTAEGPKEENSGKNPPSPLDNKSPQGDNNSGEEKNPKPEEPKLKPPRYTDHGMNFNMEIHEPEDSPLAAHLADAGAFFRGNSWWVAPNNKQKIKDLIRKLERGESLPDVASKRIPQGITPVKPNEKDANRGEWTPGKTITMYRATDPNKPHFGKDSHWFDSLENAKLYTDNPGFGGGQIYKVKVKPQQVLDLRSETKRSLAEQLAESVGPKDSPWGQFDSKESLADALEERWATYDNLYDIWENDAKTARFLEKKYKWIVHDKETYPEGATTWVALEGFK